MFKVSASLEHACLQSLAKVLDSPCHLAEVGEKSVKNQGKAKSQGTERSGNLRSRGNSIAAAQSNNLRPLYLHCISFFKRDVHEEFGLINAHLCDMLPAV